MEYNESGKLTVRTYTASGALPVNGSIIHITGVDENNRYVNYSIISDVDGVSIIGNLPAPGRSYSLTPGSAEVPYATYDIEASADGYYSKKINNVAIFSGEDAVLPINMIPISTIGAHPVYPRGTLDTTVYENEALEM